MKRGIFIAGITLWSVFTGWAQNTFTESDRRLLLEMKVRIEEMDKRLDLMDKRIEDLRADMNARFEQVDKRFEQHMNYLYMLTGIFSGVMLFLMGVVIYDRYTSVRRVVRDVEERYEVSRLRPLLDALRTLAREDSKLAEVLRQFHLL